MSGHSKWSDIKRAKGRPHYTVRAERDEAGKVWFLRVNELDGVFTQARRLEQAEAMARDVIAAMLEVPLDSFDLVIQPALDAEAESLVFRARNLRNAAAHFVAGSNTRMIATVHHLVGAQGLTMRDVSELLGMSFQRVGQLAAEPLPPDDPHLAELEAASARIMARLEPGTIRLSEADAAQLATGQSIGR